ncbi:protein exported by TAT pathway [Mycolicibacterium fortuitum]|uniref:Protein exported by TAT pathway n=1 Tax=Mycolicibacterium fortuitum TaxID=1766 RepID=A0A378UT45_MYCFO|nr:protein exported by TAT pathway [Mycolicibacterium fortuitum]
MLKYAAAAPALLGLGAGLTTPGSAAAAPAAGAPPLGVLLDYAAGVIRASDIRTSGAIGAIRYVSDRRPGGDWMLGKPIQLPEARDLYQGGLKIVSCYQYGKQETADWLGGQNAGIQHAKRGWQLHSAAGGSVGAPIYASIDDDPSFDQYKQLVAPYLRGWEAVLGHQRVGVYANSKTIEWAVQDGLGSYFWQHNWGSPGRVAHPAAHVHQVEIDKRSVGGIGVDINHILKPRYGQWD